MVISKCACYSGEMFWGRWLFLLRTNYGSEREGSLAPEKISSLGCDGVNGGAGVPWKTGRTALAVFFGGKEAQANIIG